MNSLCHCCHTLWPCPQISDCVLTAALFKLWGERRWQHVWVNICILDQSMSMLILLIMMPQCALTAVCQSNAALFLMLKPSSFNLMLTLLSCQLFSLLSSLLTWHYTWNSIINIIQRTMCSSSLSLLFSTCITCIVCDINHSVIQTCFDQFDSLPSERTA